MNINAEDFKPREKGKSDFFSWNLYRWLKKQEKSGRGAIRIYDSGSDYKSIYIGVKESHGSVCAVNLRTLCSGSGRGHFPLFGCFINSSQWKDITEEFYSEYRRIGVCAIHGDFAHEFTYIGEGVDRRMCKYCGKVEKKVVTMVERVDWEAVT